MMTLAERRKALSDTTLMFLITTVLFIISLAVTLVILQNVNIPILNKFKEMWELFSEMMNHPIFGPLVRGAWWVVKGLWHLITSVV